MAAPDDLSDLLDAPNETLESEYKASFDLDDPVARAKLAKHLAALANHGGGYLVAGFNDDMTTATQTEFPKVARDAVASIVKTYLDPPFHCDVRAVIARSGAKHTVVVVPSHGAAPVCARANGPQDNKNRVQGISAGNYYIRKPGPESAPVRTPAEWAPLIRRCVLADRASILAAIGAPVEDRGGASTVDEMRGRVLAWHADLAQAYREKTALLAPRRELLAHGYMQFTMGVRGAAPPIPIGGLLRVVERCNSDADSITKVHWGPFVVLHRDTIGPIYGTSQGLSDGEQEFLEAAVIEPSEPTHASDMWRVSGDGLASLIKGWWEDTPNFRQPPKTALSPMWLAKEVSGFVIFARALANSFETASAVTLRCEWIGLAGRMPFDHYARWTSGNKAQEDRRVITKTFSILEINGSWERTAAEIIGPVARSVGLGHILTEQWLANESSTWARQA